MVSFFEYLQATPNIPWVDAKQRADVCKCKDAFIGGRKKPFFCFLEDFFLSSPAHLHVRKITMQCVLQNSQHQFKFGLEKPVRPVHCPILMGSEGIGPKQKPLEIRSANIRVVHVIHLTSSSCMQRSR